LSCGEPVAGCTVRICDEPGGETAAKLVGEIWVGGAHVSPGTWNGLTQGIDPFDRASIGPDGTRFVPTGDLGALIDGELVPLDRIKDTIITYGQKLHASDVEAKLLAHPDAGDILSACAFSLEGDSDPAIVILCEMDRRKLNGVGAEGIATKLAKAVADAFGVLPQVGILAYGSLPRTTSGKIQRFNSKALYRDGKFRNGTFPPGRQPHPME